MNKQLTITEETKRVEELMKLINAVSDKKDVVDRNINKLSEISDLGFYQLRVVFENRENLYLDVEDDLELIPLLLTHFHDRRDALLKKAKELMETKR